jgi:CRP-like cAMP-binding protein
MTTETVTSEVLQSCANLCNLGRDELEKLGAIAKSVSLKAEQIVFADMDPAEYLYLLVKGEVHICCELGNGEIRVMDTVEAGELFAWSALVKPFRYTSTARCAADCELVAFDARALRKLCADDVDLGNKVLNCLVRLLANRLESVRVQLAAS